MLKDKYSRNMVRRGLSFRLLYRVILFCFSVTLVGFYLDGTRQEEKPKQKYYFKQVLRRRPKNVLKFSQQDQKISSSTGNAEYVNYGKRPNKTDLTLEITRKGENLKYKNFPNTGQESKNSPALQNVTKTGRSDETVNRSKLKSNHLIPRQPYSLPSSASADIKVTGKGVNTKFVILYSSNKKPRNGINKICNTTRHFIKDGNIAPKVFKGIDEGKEFGSLIIRKVSRGLRSVGYKNGDMSICNDFMINIQYDDGFRVWNNLSVLYKNKIYDYTEYRVLNDGIQICNSTDINVQNNWKQRNNLVRDKKANTNCTARVDVWRYPRNYTIDKYFIMYWAPSSQYFTRNDYSVLNSHPFICKGKIKPPSMKFTAKDMAMCNDSIIKIKYDDEYRVLKHFSVLYKMKIFDFTEYRVLDDGINICSSTDVYVQNRWKLRNGWVKKRVATKSCPKHTNLWRYQRYYTIDKHFIMYWVPSGQFFTRIDYWAHNGHPFICKGRIKPPSMEFTSQDMTICNDSIINIMYDDEFTVWKNFSIIYKNKMYDYIEYRTLNDGIKICNSTDVYTLNNWKSRNKWVKYLMPKRNCTTNSKLLFRHYVLDKQFNVYWIPSGQYFKRNDYGVRGSNLYICKGKLGPVSREFTKKDLITCAGAIINIKYEEEYKIWTNFSILYRRTVYDYTEYRVLNDGIKICNSTDKYVQNIWKLRNEWVEDKKCSSHVHHWFLQGYYTFDKQFNIYLINTGQSFKRNEYSVSAGNPYICKEMLRPLSTEFTMQDMSMCNSSFISLKYDDEFKVWKNFSVLYENMMYDFTEYRTLNDGIKICNSSDIYVQSSWKLRNSWVKKRMGTKDCATRVLYRWSYSLSKQFTVYWAPSGRFFKRNDYSVSNGRPYICKERVGLKTRKFIEQDMSICNDSVIKIKYDDEFRIYKNFSIIYNSKIYDTNEYRPLNDSIEICNSTDIFVQNIWKLRNDWVKGQISFDDCTTRVLYSRTYSLNKQFTLYWALSGQFFKRNDYSVLNGSPIICKEKIGPLSVEFTKEDMSICNDSIINMRYDDEFQVWKNFSIIFKNKTYYDYTEYRALSDGIKICNSTDIYVQNIWKLRNYWVKEKLASKNCTTDLTWLSERFYAVDKKLNVYLIRVGQYFTRHDYGVWKTRPFVCKGKLRPASSEFTKQDLYWCRDDMINLQYEEKYKVWNNFSLLYKDKMYDYNEYRALNDGIKICNSTDIYVQNSWKLRNDFVKDRMKNKDCSTNVTWAFRRYYNVDKRFTVYLPATAQYIARNDYWVFKRSLYICNEKLQTVSNEFTKEDLLMCRDAVISIQYEEKYILWKNFSILYRDKMYDHNEYRALNDGIKICNSTDIYVGNNWKMRNFWVKDYKAHENCSTSVAFPWRRYYTVDKHFKVYLATTGQHFEKNSYGLWGDKFHICREKLKPESNEFTKEDQVMCSEALINIQYDENYKVWQNFSILYKEKMYDYTEYRVLNDSITICNSTDTYVMNSWKLRNDWVNNNLLNKNCTSQTRTVRLRRWADYYDVISDGPGISFNLISHVFISSKKSKKTIVNNDFGLTDGKFYKCSDKLWLLSYSRHVIIFLCALALSSICLLLLLIVYCMLPELRTLPGMNLMSLSIAFLFANVALMALSSVNFIEKKIRPCAPWLIAITSCTSSIVTNAAVNVYHLRKTFSGDSCVKSISNSSNFKLFLKYTVFSWGIPAILSIAEIIAFKVGLVSYFHDHSTGFCRTKYLYFAGYFIRELILPGFLILYTIVVFICTSYQIRRKLKASSNIAHKSNIIRNRQSFVLLLKLSTTAGLTWIPFLIFMNVNFYPEVKMALGFVTLLSGVYIAISFVFTRKNYKLLKTKYFSGS